MLLRVFTEPQQGARHADLLAVVRRAEDAGYDAFFRSDHYLPFSGNGRPGPSDAWTTLAGLARETTRIRLGTLVSPATFREPAVLALQVAQVDDMSDGRVELGLGAGWFAQEHQAFGLGFPETSERFDRFEEQLEIITSLWSMPVGERYTFEGAHHRVVDNPGLPKPVQAQVPLVIGGGGKRRTPQLAAEYATEFNIGFCDLDEVAARVGRVRAACAAAGRDPATLAVSYAATTVVGRDDAEVARRVAAIGADPAELRRDGLCGTPAEVVDRLGALAALGVDRAYVQLLDLADLDHVDLVAGEVMPQVA
ncbi:LLM class F420-dependent oxidoreductase [Kineosporia sp. R_H_3]|uniref:LLM class F420-dependent oxidoreductase n=1 Tax=Kineosporia sp. R_H_3 TaxID=1961848 RepID=UPI000B4B188B|nr:LLM class F420-dependent oxidoreductase [Kineosporia sp. R_H_3]